MTWSKSQLTSCDIPVPNAPLKDECMSYPYSVDWLSEQPMTCNLHTSLQEERMPYPCSFDWFVRTTDDMQPTYIPTRGARVRYLSGTSQFGVNA